MQNLNRNTQIDDIIDSQSYQLKQINDYLENIQLENEYSGSKVRLDKHLNHIEQQAKQNAEDDFKMSVNPKSE